MAIFGSLANLETGLLALAVVVLMYFTKGLVSALLNGNRQRPWVKKQLLPGLAVILGLGLSTVIHPACLEHVGARLLWGGVVGFFATSFYRLFLSEILKVPDKRIAEAMGSWRPPPKT